MVFNIFVRRLNYITVIIVVISSTFLGLRLRALTASANALVDTFGVAAERKVPLCADCQFLCFNFPYRAKIIGTNAIRVKAINQGMSVISVAEDRSRLVAPLVVSSMGFQATMNGGC